MRDSIDAKLKRKELVQLVEMHRNIYKWRVGVTMVQDNTTPHQQMISKWVDSYFKFLHLAQKLIL